ncbi:hypothetical protein LCGC14_0642040 [marine sediment metagenome]|uniref:Uncharacterized protein n=1 Tax=marine sediment metagenome TaxID=412755 RepID=A0A0F9RIB2_9ZZZZ
MSFWEWYRLLEWPVKILVGAGIGLCVFAIVVGVFSWLSSLRDK